MFNIINEFDNYKAVCCSRADVWRTSYHHSAYITLYKGTTHVGTIKFQNESSTLKDSYFRGRIGTPNVINLFYFDKDFDRVLSMLQKESPLYVGIRTSPSETHGIGAITTDPEPVGDEEGN